MPSGSDGGALLIIGLLFLTVPGILYNNLNNQGLITPNGTSCPAGYTISGSLCCSNNSSNPVCVLAGTVGCQTNPAYCSLSGQTISFFNSNSPFTQMLQGNIFALFTAINGPGYSGPGAQSTPFASHGPFDVVQGSSALYYQANCFGNTGGATGSQTHWVPTSCTQTYTDNANVSEANAVSWTNWNTQQSATTQTTHFYRLTGNATFGFECNWLAQINYTLTANGPGYTYFGCSLYTPLASGSGNIAHARWSILIAMPVNLGVMPTSNSHEYLYVQLENWETMECVSSQGTGAGAVFNSQPCQGFLNSFKGVQLPFFPQNTSFVPNGAAATVFGFFGGILLFILGLGLQFGFGGGLSIGVNPQATKLAQVMGLGLILWSFFYSQFSVWFTSGIFPFGLDGNVGMIALCIDALIFAGLFFMAHGSSPGVTAAAT